MLFVLSPSKTLDEKSPLPKLTPTQPALLKESQLLVDQLRTLSEAKIAKLMDISDKLAALNHARFRDFKTPFTAKNARPALFTFKGDVYAGMGVADYTPAQLDYAQKHLRILSGLYGLLRPLDLMQPYRLEMGTGLKNARGKDLYAFWGERVSEQLNVAAKEGGNVLINLASEEYAKAIKAAVFKGEIINIVFKEQHKGALKIIGIHAKRARGLMVDYAIKQKLSKPEALKKFDVEGYAFAPKLSAENIYVFVR